MSENGRSRRALPGGIAAPGVAARPGKAFATTHTFSPVQRDFSDPYRELIRLLKEDAEIEHDLMVQYLHGAFSLRPTYAEVVGTPAPNATTLLGVIVEEMHHLAAVNRLRVALEAKPGLPRQDFPYETDVYPFPFEMAPPGPTSLAKYVNCERVPRCRSTRSAWASIPGSTRQREGDSHTGCCGRRATTPGRSTNCCRATST
jgi:hypothetical protein